MQKKKTRSIALRKHGWKHDMTRSVVLRKHGRKHDAKIPFPQIANKKKGPVQKNVYVLHLF